MNPSGHHLLEFPAVVITLDGRQFKCAARVEYYQHDPTSLDISLTWTDPLDTDMVWFPSWLNPSRVEIKSRSPAFEDLLIYGMDHVSATQERLSFRPAAITIGIDSDPIPEATEVAFAVSLQPSGILALPSSRLQMANGAVALTQEIDAKIEIETDLGPIRAVASFEYAQDTEHGNRISKQIARAVLNGKLVLANGDSFEEQHERLLDDIELACRVLSLCYRQGVGAYEVAYFSRDAASNTYKRRVYRRRWKSSKSRHPGPELVGSLQLTDGGLNRLFHALKDHPYSNALQRAVDFTSASYGAYVETSFFMSFSALETAINVALGELADNVVTRGEWKRVEEALKGALDQLAVAGTITSEQAQQLRNKLPEIRRPPVITRAQAAISKLGVHVDDLWPESGLGEGLANAAKLRNGLFHAADTDKPFELASDLLRIRILAERIILACLGWPKSEIWPWHAEALDQLSVTKSD